MEEYLKYDDENRTLISEEIYPENEKFNSYYSNFKKIFLENDENLFDSNFCNKKDLIEQLRSHMSKKINEKDSLITKKYKSFFFENTFFKLHETTVHPFTIRERLLYGKQEWDLDREEKIFNSTHLSTEYFTLNKINKIYNEIPLFFFYIKLSKFPSIDSIYSFNIKKYESKENEKREIDMIKSFIKVKIFYEKKNDE